MTSSSAPAVNDDEHLPSGLMRAIAQTEYGGPEVLSLQTVPKPVPQDSQVLVRVSAASVSAGDWHLMRGKPLFIRPMFGGVFKPRIRTLGSDMAGIVEAVGAGVTQFQPGDAVFGDLSECGFGAFAEYVCVPESALVLKPETISFESAAAVPGSALAALQGLRDCGQIQPGQKVLINGASSGVGSLAVQLAKVFGAEVTAVCSGKKADRVRFRNGSLRESLHPDHIVDYTQTDFTKTGQRYDLILDVAAYRSILDYLPALTPKGTYVLVGGATAQFLQGMLLGSLISRIRGRKVTCLATKPNQADLLTLRELLGAGKIAPCIGQRYDLSEVPTAIHHLEQRQVIGKAVIGVAEA
jgi:NADPH:quinone reductase-like Zn-dependent oxidoreductase